MSTPVTTPLIEGQFVRLRLAEKSDIPRLVEIRREPAVFARWRGGDDLVAAIEEDFAEKDTVKYVIEYDDRVVGWIQWSAEDDPDYRHANMDIYLSTDVAGRGLGTDAVRTLARHLVDEHGYHRLEIDPAADNEPAIRCYAKVGFRPVGIQRQAERGNDGTWHDALLMDLLADEITNT